MNILHYETDKIKYEQLCDMSKFVNNEFGKTIFLPNSTHLLADANACELILVMEQLCDALEKNQRRASRRISTSKRNKHC